MKDVPEKDRRHRIDDWGKVSVSGEPMIWVKSNKVNEPEKRVVAARLKKVEEQGRGWAVRYWWKYDDQKAGRYTPHSTGIVLDPSNPQPGDAEVYYRSTPARGF